MVDKVNVWWTKIIRWQTNYVECGQNKIVMDKLYRSWTKKDFCGQKQTTMDKIIMLWTKNEH